MKPKTSLRRTTEEALPRLRAEDALRPPNPGTCVDHDAAARQPENRIEIKFGDSREVLAQPAQAVDEIHERLLVGGRSAAKAGDELPCLPGRDELLGVDVRQW